MWFRGDDPTLPSRMHGWYRLLMAAWCPRHDWVVAEHWPRKLCLFPVAPGAWNTVTHILFARKVKVVQSRPRLTLCNPMDYTFHGILQARILEWVAFAFFRGSSLPRDQTQVSCIAGGFFITVPPGKPLLSKITSKSQMGWHARSPGPPTYIRGASAFLLKT